MFFDMYSSMQMRNYINLIIICRDSLIKIRFKNKLKNISFFCYKMLINSYFMYLYLYLRML